MSNARQLRITDPSGTSIHAFHALARATRKSGHELFRFLMTRLVADPPAWLQREIARAQDPGDALLTVDDVARELRVHPRTVHRWLHAGELQGHRVGPHWRIRRRDLTAYLNARRM
jgi:excisionase family DNA binding protein